MHEMSIAVSLLEKVLDVAKAHRAEAVEEIEVEVGALSLVDPEALKGAFSVAAEGTGAAGAALRVIERQGVMRCQDCGRTFQTDGRRFICPGCNQAVAQIVEGRGVVLKSLTCRTDEEAQP